MMELLPTDRFYLLNQGDEHTGASCSNYPTGANHPSFEHAVLAATPNIIPFDRSGSNQMNVDSFVPVQSSSYARHVVPRIPYYMPPNDRYPEASSSSQTIPNETFGRKQVSNQPLVSHNANFNSIGRIGAPPTKNCKGRSGALKKARNSPYKPKAPGPQNSRRDICPPPSVEKFFADGRNKYVRLTDFQINELLKVYNVASHKIPELFFGLQRIHSPEVLYTCPMEACKAEYTLDQLETHYLAHHSTISCDSSCPSRGDKASTNHTSLCRWFISCEDHEYTATFSATEARAHFEDVHLYPHGVQCPHCGSLHPRLRLLYMHMSGKGCSGLRKWRRSE
ncbi:hypothetical protein DFS33DRAFT_242032 [Desarmillaria ectypa]|nr:hypothetical protein DFS33DRAFT_242032 [Desarmillaria ectypa]